MAYPGRNYGVGELQPLARRLANISRRGGPGRLKQFAREVADRLGNVYSATTTQNYMSQIKSLARSYGADLAELEGYEGPGTSLWPRLGAHRAHRGIPFGYPPWMHAAAAAAPADYGDDGGDDGGPPDDEPPPPPAHHARKKRKRDMGAVQRLRSQLKRTRSGTIYGRGRKRKTKQTRSRLFRTLTE